MKRPIKEEKPGSGFEMDIFLMKLLKNYPWFIVCAIVFLAGGFLYLRYATPLYQVSAFVEIKPPVDGITMLGGSPFSSSSNSANRNVTDLTGEIFKLQSSLMLEEAIDSLKLNIEITESGKIKEVVRDRSDAPFDIAVNRKAFSRNSEIYKLQLESNSFIFQNDKTKFIGRYTVPFVVEGDTITISRKDIFSSSKNKDWQIRFLGRQETIAKYAGRLTVSLVAKGGSNMLQLLVKDEISSRAKQIVTLIIDAYDKSNFEFRNMAIRSEIEFLDKRLDSVNAELQIKENYIKNFKKQNRIVDVPSSASLALTNLSAVQTKKTENEYKQRLLVLIEDDLARTGSSRAERINVPGLQDADLVTLVAKYNDLVFQKNDVLEKGTAMDLRLPTLNTQLFEIKNNIQNRIRAIREELMTSNGFLDSQAGSFTDRFVSLPEKEKDYTEVNRLLNVKQTLYVFLLQKKEDKHIELASTNIQQTRVVDWKMSSIQDPKPIMVYGIALAAAMLLPTVWMLVFFMMDKKIASSKQVYDATLLPIAGEIGYVEKLKTELAIKANDVSPVAEQIRTLRTNISYLNGGEPRQVLLVTSGVSGEGKSFISLNLATALALGKKKVVLVEFDLRNPSLCDEVQVEYTQGVCDFLEGESSIEEIIQPVKYFESLFFVNSGSFLPADPGEIIHSKKMNLLFDYLRRNFDFVVLDTPPIEAVSDALILSKWADAFFFVVRHKYSLRSSLARVNQLHADKKVTNAALIINGIMPGDGFNNVHGYGYGYEGKLTKRKMADLVKINKPVVS
jgi:tyrosine-protein kinase Etk/Wzc